MSQNNWNSYIYEISDTLKYALGEYCLSLYKTSIGTKNYLAQVMQYYRGLGNRQINAQDERAFLKQSETRIWLKLIKNELNTRLTDFVQEPSLRSLAEQYLIELIEEYNAVYHQQEIDYTATARKSLQLLQLTDTNSETIETAIRSIEAIITQMHKIHAGAPVTANHQNGSMSKQQANGNSRTPIIDESLPILASITAPNPGNSLPFFSEAAEETEQPYTEMIQAYTQYTLLVRMADGRQIETVLNSDEFIVGRSTKAHLTIDDPCVSLQHIMICCKNEQIYLIDLGSKNGTTMNRAKIISNTQIPWHIEQPIKIGSTRLSLTWTT